MWRKVAAALVAAAVGATPVLAIETASPPATVPAKITPLAKPKASTRTSKSSTKTASITGKIKVPRNHRATRIAAKVGNKSAHQLRNKVGKAGVNHKRVVDAAKSPKLSPRLSPKLNPNLGRNVYPKQSWKQHAKLLPKSKGVQAAEPVETTGSVAPRSVPAPGLY